MKIGVPKEIKKQEYRVSLSPQAVKELCADGNEVFVETNAGTAIGFDDAQYQQAGAKILSSAKDVFDAAELIVKVKEPQAIECAMLKPHQTLFTYLHLAADKPQAEGLMKSGCTAIAYETVSDDQGRTPLLAPMSRVAGRLSIIVGSYYLQSHMGGIGTLISGVQEAEPANVVIFGMGQAGVGALKMAIGLDARVTAVDISEAKLKQLKEEYGAKINVELSTKETVARLIKTADIVIGATYIPGHAASKLITKDMLKTMKPGSVLVDISIDQGGCFETSRPTTHQDPVYVVDGVLHYCVANMPGAVARTSTIALCKNTLPYVKELAKKGVDKAIAENEQLARGVNIMGGALTNEPVAEALHLPFTPLKKNLKAA